MWSIILYGDVDAAKSRDVLSEKFGDVALKENGVITLIKEQKSTGTEEPNAEKS